MGCFVITRAALTCSTALLGIAALPGAAWAQEQSTRPAATPTGAETPESGATTLSDPERRSASSEREILVTGSRIKQDPNDSALPLQIVTNVELQRNAISSPEQLLAFLPNNGSGADNLASNSDVVDSTRRGNNGTSFANLRGQGPGGTLILLNGRRVSAHGLTGAAVDVNQIPFTALDRVEVLKDGASAIYGTDAVGGVINFITRKDFTGIGASAFTDITDEGDSPVYRLSAIAGVGDLDEQGFNVMATVGYTYRGALQARQRDFVNTFQKDRGLGVDTRGTPFATIVPFGGSAFPNGAAMPIIPGTADQRATGGVNILRLPGQPGCDTFDLMGDYDTDVWGAPSNGLACTFDTGRNVYLQQQIETITYYGRAVKRLGEHELAFEISGSSAKSDKRFSQIQITPSSSRNYSFSLVEGVNDAKYARIYNTLVNAFPELEETIPYGAGFSYRWRCLECGERQLKTKNDTLRAVLDMSGPLFGDWDYQVGAMYAQSKGRSKVGEGYYYQDALVAALNSGYVDPFLFPGEEQSAEGLAALAAASANGVTLYSGKYSVKEADASVSGSLFELPAGTVKIAAGINYRREEYEFTGDTRTDPQTIFAAPFDNGNALDGVHRDIKAAYAELLVPIIEGMELTAAGRIDDYSGFGTTTNPKISLKYRPFEPILLRGSFNTAFRVPTFNQIFNPSTSATYTGADYADPSKCPGGVVNAEAGCPALSTANGQTFEVITGGRLDLGPETADEYSAGVVFMPTRNISVSADWWLIKRKNTIQTLPLQYLFQFYDLFKDQFIYENGQLVAVDNTYVNTGGTTTEGIDFTVRGVFPVGPGQIGVGLDGTWLLKKEEKVAAGSDTIDQLGVYSLAADLGLKWKHNAYVSYGTEDWIVTLTQIFRSGYDNQVLPGVEAGTFDPCCDITKVKDYIYYNLSVSYTGIEGVKFTAGVTNLFDKDPPFAISYDSNYGSGSSWEPRVADPRGRAFNMLAEFKF
ncbi:hypothetical protein B2G71_01640 [Novosphingobium sp. PC22D]|uniref:TonB-dependent receptor domain-containing protein n=1 Tax=Novosphingobium sp. PC22D TaxID=1962403 RepID=UPI000BF0EED1|nr:TonB-dependent receptor [Novosphingobium sp. PC22D]PEQ14331.1 hypothetical protein B2G71_01640 [Novosphingobium sp. PC22D]